VYGNARVYGDARVHGDARVSGDARVYDIRHVLIFGPVGGNSVMGTLTRTDGGHCISIGCWTGTLDTLLAEVEIRRAAWKCPPDAADALVAQYQAVEALGRATIASWDWSNESQVSQ
jgi:hypothetical protein